LSIATWSYFSEEEIDAVSAVLSSGKINYWTGSECRQFEQEFASYTEVKYAVAMANGTVALDASLRALNLLPGDEVIVTSRTFFASVSALVNIGAIPVFADVDPSTQNISASTINEVLTEKTRAIVCVHLAGWPCDMDPILRLARAHQLFVIEDCAQAHGAKYKGQSVGSFGDVSCWSFCQDKIITTGGEGGMVTTNRKDIWSFVWSYKDHGKSYDAVHSEEHSAGFRWLHHSFGTNLRMTEIQAAIGRIQLRKLESWNQKRRSNCQMIWDALSDLNVIRIPYLACDGCRSETCVDEGCRNAAYKSYVFVEAGETMRDFIMKKITQNGIPCSTGSCSEVYLEKAFVNQNFSQPRRLTVAKRLGETSLMFLCHPTLGQDEMALICEVARDAVTNSTTRG